MFDKTLKKWKSEWLDKYEEALCKEFEADLEELKHSFSKTLGEWQAKHEELQKRIETESQQVSLKENEYGILLKKLEASKKNVEDQIRLLEAKASPTNVWTEAFSTGFSKAWDMMMPVMMDGVMKSKKIIEDLAIQETIKRNGNHKKNN